MYLINTWEGEIGRLGDSKRAALKAALAPYVINPGNVFEIRTRHPAEVGMILGQLGLRVWTEGWEGPGQKTLRWSVIRPVPEDVSRLGAGFNQLVRQFIALVAPDWHPEEIFTFSPAFVANDK